MVEINLSLANGNRLSVMHFPGRKKPLLMASNLVESVEVGVVTDLPAFRKFLGLPPEEEGD